MVIDQVHHNTLMEKVQSQFAKGRPLALTSLNKALNWQSIENENQRLRRSHSPKVSPRKKRSKLAFGSKYFLSCLATPPLRPILFFLTRL